MTQKRVAAVILAAGRSSRMGSPKQRLELNGKTLLRRTVETVVASFGHAHVVLGFHAAEFQKSLHDLPVSPVFAPDWESGLSHSVKAALAFVEETPSFDAVLFVPCDLPLLSSEHLNALVAAYQSSNAPLVVSRWDDVLGVPALFDRALWPELRTLTGDEGARKIIRRHEKVAVGLPFEGGLDLDTPQQVEDFLSQGHKADGRIL